MASKITEPVLPGAPLPVADSSGVARVLGGGFVGALGGLLAGGLAYGSLVVGLFGALGGAVVGMIGALRTVEER